MTQQASNINSHDALESGQPPRFVTASGLFDGHDAAINVIRRILQASGAEVIHLAHNRSVQEVIESAIQEDVDAIAVSSYQGGHVEYFKYMIDLLKQRNADHILVFGGGGGVIIPTEVAELHEYGVTRIYTPQDGQTLGLQGMINDMLGHSRILAKKAQNIKANNLVTNRDILARFISNIENNQVAEIELQNLSELGESIPTPVFGITGTGGAGKSSLTDELIGRFNLNFTDDFKIAILAIDPTRQKTGGALLGDRIRMNAIYSPNVFMRSIANRSSSSDLPACLQHIINAIKVTGFDLIIVETPGIGQGDTSITRFVDKSLYVMTPEFGAATQLEKIDMLDFADVVAINKYDRKGGADAVRDVAKQLQRNHLAFDNPIESMPVFGTIASRFNDDGITALFQHISNMLNFNNSDNVVNLADISQKVSSQDTIIIPPNRQHYLSEITDTCRHYRAFVETQACLARQRQQLMASRDLLKEQDKEIGALEELITSREQALDKDTLQLLEEWPKIKAQYDSGRYTYEVRGKKIHVDLNQKTLSGTLIPRIITPKFEDHGECLRWLMLENLPGRFPYTAGVFPFKREGEEPTRMFAGEGDAARTNRRFKALSSHSPAKRLSTAFDSVTLYGFDPDERPDIYGKIGTSGVSIATLDDMKELYAGFDLCDPSTSVSMTINGPAPTILAMFFNAAMEQQIEKFTNKNNRGPGPDELDEIKTWTLQNVRGTVQADILKEDQGQNTCIFSTEFSLKMMGDIQEYFIQNNINNYYSVSISGYHIAEAGANPITQLALTLSNGFTYVETYLARGMHIDDFASNLSFFFSNGMDPEYTVLGRVARRIWATVIRDKYGGNERSQKLKYHIQTSGRSLHAQEMAFNDIRTTLQALIAIYDNCNSLHTNAFDEAITTPTDESVNRAIAIQLIINKEWGLTKNENPNQGAFIIDELTDLVEEAVLKEFDRISQRGGVLGAMETGYQRNKIQEESLLYEHKKHDGSLPVVGVNTFQTGDQQLVDNDLNLSRSTEAEKQQQIKRLRNFHEHHAAESEMALTNLKQAVIENKNVFVELMNTVRFCSLGQITQAFFEVGGQYRRNM